MAAIEVEADIALAEQPAVIVLIQPGHVGVQRLATADTPAIAVVHLAGFQVQLGVTAQGPLLVVQGIAQQQMELIVRVHAALAVIQGVCIEFQHTDRPEVAGAVIEGVAGQGQVGFAADASLALVIEAAQVQAEVASGRQQADLVKQVPGNGGGQGAVAGELTVGVVQARCSEREVAARGHGAVLIGQCPAVDRQGVVALSLTVAVVQTACRQRKITGQQLAAAVVQQAVDAQVKAITGT